MKNGKNRDVGASNGGVGNKGVATAPRPPFTGKSKYPSANELGLGPVSTNGTSFKEHLNNDAPRSPEPASLEAIARVPTPVDMKDLKVSIIDGDDGDKYFLFRTPARQIVRPFEMVIQNKLRVMADLRHVGIFATSTSIKSEVQARIDAAQLNIGVVAATRVGFERQPLPRYFVYGDGTVITARDDVQVVPLRENQSRFEHAGKLSKYEKGVTKVIRNQPVPITLFFFSLTQVLKPFVAGTGYKAENMMFELVGRTSTYKSALACTLAGSIWGKPHTLDGYARSWNMSDQKIEELFSEFNDHLLILDEVTAAHQNEKTRAERVLNTVHRLSSGQGRARSGLQAQSHSVSMLSTSNEPMRLILPSTEEVRRALEVRLISFQLSDDKESFFVSIPKGFISVDAAMGYLFDITESNFGLLARRFIRNTLGLLQQDEVKLSTLIKQSVAEFIQSVGLDENGVDEVLRRRVQPFALAYAAAMVAFETTTLKKKRWGHVGASIRQAWNDIGSEKPSNAGDFRLVAYMTDPSNTFVDARGKVKPYITDKNFRRVAGFFHLGKDRGLCLAVPNAAVKKLNLSSAALKQMKISGVLRAGKNLQSKLVLRRVGTEEKRDVFYVFRVPEIPQRTTVVKDE
jgi:hypothetical protein